MVYFENFSANSQHYILPDQLKTGVPVFHYPEYSMSNTPELYIPDLANIPSFLSYWKPISSLGNWQFFNVLTSFIQAFCLLEQDIFLTDRELPRLSSNYFTFSL